jgi:hypothetical protein
MYDTAEVTAELIGGDGLATESIRHANIVSFTCLKSIAYDDRHERKDAHDLVYCLEQVPEKVEGVAAKFRDGLTGKHRDVLLNSLGLLRKRFVTDANAEGYLKDGPVAVAKFALGESEEEREARALRQRDASVVVEGLLNAVGN